MPDTSVDEVLVKERCLLRAFEVAPENFMERRSDALAGHKHHVTKDFLGFLKQQTMEMCQQENLNQVDLLQPAKVRITDREYWAQRRGQKEFDKQAAATRKPASRYETQNMILRKQIMETLQDSHSFDEFERKLLSNYGIAIQESRGQISYHLPDRINPIRGKTLGTDFERASILRYFSIGHRFVSDSTIRLATDISQNEKAKNSPAYANAIKKENLLQESKAVAYLIEHGLSIAEMERRYSLAYDDYHAQSAALNKLDEQIKQIKSVKHYLNDYYHTKGIHKEYLASKDKKKYRENNPELTIYDTAVKELRSVYGKETFPSRKHISDELNALIKQKNEQYENFCSARNHFREIQIVRNNFHALQGSERMSNAEHINL